MSILVVEPISLQRQPFPELEALYFLSPSVKSIEFLNDDFEDKTTPQYAAAHIFVTTRVYKVFYF